MVMKGLNECMQVSLATILNMNWGQLSVTRTGGIDFRGHLLVTPIYKKCDIEKKKKVSILVPKCSYFKYYLESVLQFDVTRLCDS